jgi:hypothetical protein
VVKVAGTGMVYSSLKQLIPIALTLLLSFEALAQVESDIQATTRDGKQVLLKSDHTWDFVPFKEDDPSMSAILTVAGVREMERACGLDLRLQNNLGFRIRSLVPRFAIYNKDGVLFDTASKSFASIKPTLDQYAKIQFTGIGCHEISHLQLVDASHCVMGDIDIFNEEEGQCLSHIYVEPSQLINITK